MSDAPIHDIEPAAFHADPYPDLALMRAKAPAVRVPQLGATLFVKREAIFREEKRVETFSSRQPDGLMTRLMGENMMRKDGEAHLRERRATFPALSPRTVRDVWKARFESAAATTLDSLSPKGGCDLVKEFAAPVSAEALKTITGLSDMAWQDIDKASQDMIDGISNYAGDPDVEARCRESVDMIDAHIDAWLADAAAHSDPSLLSVQIEAGLPMESVRANVKLAISGGQNEPRDAIAGAAWALLTHPEQMALIRDGKAGWRDAFEEYARWISPIGMSPRRVARPDAVCGARFEPGELIFFMFGSGNRDEEVFAVPETFDIARDTSPSLAFGAGPHFCAGAAAARTLIAEVALPMMFDRLTGLRLAGEVPFAGWAFRGPVAMPVAWDV